MTDKYDYLDDSADDSLDRHVSTIGFTSTSFLKGVIGAAIGGAVGYFVTDWLAAQGFLGMMIPGGLLGFGFSLGAKRPWIGYALFCAIAALLFGLFSEAMIRPFVADGSLDYFIRNLNKVGIVDWIMILIGAVMAYSFNNRRGYHGR